MVQTRKSMRLEALSKTPAEKEEHEVEEDEQESEDGVEVATDDSHEEQDGELEEQQKENAGEGLTEDSEEEQEAQQQEYVVEEIPDDSDDEAPEEVTQKTAKAQHEEDQSAMETVREEERKKSQKREEKKKMKKRGLLAALQHVVEEELPEDLLAQAALAKSELDKKLKQDRKDAKNSAKRKKVGPVVIGGRKSEEEVKEYELPARSDNIQLAVSRYVNGKEVIVYQGSNKQTSFSDDESESEEEVNMDQSVQNFASNFLMGKRQTRVKHSALKKASHVSRPKEPRYGSNRASNKV